jgi:tetratricopeptide (TPR) repeat protein
MNRAPLRPPAEATPAASPAERLGERLGRYVILSALGEGGMGKVYAAFDAELDRKVAIKVLHHHVAVGEVSLEARGRLLREAQAMAKLSHPNVVAIHDVGTVDGDVFLAMECVEGGTLRDWLRTPRPWREALEVMKAAGRGLAAAHQVGLIHRDFKPDNVLFGKDGRPRVTDFGIARIGDQPEAHRASGREAVARHTVTGSTAVSSRPVLDLPVVPQPQPRTSPVPVRTMTGGILGTPGYMAPEQVEGGTVDARSDQFSFCVTVYQVLYGERPFRGTSLEEYVHAVLQPVAAPPLGSRVPAWVRRVLLKGLSRDAHDRYESMGALLAALEQDPRVGRRKWLALGAVVMACAAGAMAWGRHRQQLRSACMQGPTLVAEVWNGPVEARVRAALESAGGKLGGEVAPRVTARLGEYAHEWASAYRAVSEATLLRGEQSADVMRLRVQCLERGRTQLGALVEVLAQANASVVQHAPDAAYALPPPARCITSDLNSIPTLPASPELRARAVAVERAVARASALVAAGADLRAEDIVEGTLPEARAIGYERAEASLLFFAGQAKRWRGDNAAALSAFQAALSAAERAGDDSLAAQAAAWTAFVFTWLGKPREGAPWIDLAEAIAQRAGHDDATDAIVLMFRIVVIASLGHPEKAMELHDREIALFEKAYGARDTRVATAIMDRGVTETTLGKFEAALSDLERAIALMAAATGPSNQHLDLPYYDLGDALAQSGRPAEAKSAFEHVLGLQAGRPPGSITVATYAGLAAVETDLGDIEGAVRAANAGLEAADAANERGEYRWVAFVARAQARGKRGDVAGQIEDCAHVLAEQRAQGALSRDSLYSVDALTCLGEAELTAHRVASAIDYLEESVGLEHRDSHAKRPLAQFALARALRVAGRDPERARTLAESARSALAGDPGRQRELAAIDAWLKDPAVVRR